MSSGLPNILSERDALELDQMMEEAKAQKVKSPSRKSPPVQPASPRKPSPKKPESPRKSLSKLKEQLFNDIVNFLQSSRLNKNPVNIRMELLKNAPYKESGITKDDFNDIFKQAERQVKQLGKKPRKPQRSKPGAKRPRSNKPYVPKKECRDDEYRNFDTNRCIQFKSDLAFKFYKLYHHWTDPTHPLYGRNARERAQFEALVIKYSDPEFQQNIKKFFSTETGKKYLKEIEQHHTIKKVQKKAEEKQRKAITPCPVYIRKLETGHCHPLTKPLLKEINTVKDVRKRYYIPRSVNQCKAYIAEEQANIQKAQRPKPKPIPRKSIEKQPRQKPAQKFEPPKPAQKSEQKKKVNKPFEPPRFGYGV